MKDIADFASDAKRLVDVGAFEAKLCLRPQVGQIGFISRDEIVEREYFPAFRKQAVAKMRPKKPRSARDHSPHTPSQVTPKLHIL